MPDDEVCDWRALGEQLVRDIDARVPGTECIAYVNYTTRDDRCLHVEYQPRKDVSSSSDTGHIHISFRTDYVTSHVMAGYDPVARLLGEDDMTVLVQLRGHTEVYVSDLITRRLVRNAAELAALRTVLGSAVQTVASLDPYGALVVAPAPAAPAEPDTVEVVLSEAQLDALADKVAPRLLDAFRAHPLAPTL